MKLKIDIKKFWPRKFVNDPPNLQTIRDHPCMTSKNSGLAETVAGLANLGNMRSKLSFKCATTLEIGRHANTGSYPTTATRFWAIEIWLLVYHFGPFRMIRSIFFWMHSDQGWAENSNPGIYRWILPVFPGMANKAQVANNGKYNFFAAKYWQIWFLAVKCSRYL